MRVNAALTTLISLSLFSFFGAHQAYAAAVEVTPTTFEIRATPETVIPNQIKYVNHSGSDLVVSVEVKDIAPVGEEGEVQVTNNPKYAISSFTTASPKSFKVASQGSKIIEFVMVVPAGTRPGGRFGLINFTAAGQPDQGSVVLLNIPGYVSGTPKLLSFGAELLTSGPEKLVLRARNDNENFLKVSGKVTIHNLLNQKVGEVDIPARNVLAGAIRRVEVIWDQGNLFGIYRAELELSNDKTQEKVSATSYFVGTAIPPQLLFGLSLVILGATVVLRKRR